MPHTRLAPDQLPTGESSLVTDHPVAFACARVLLGAGLLRSAYHTHTELRVAAEDPDPVYAWCTVDLRWLCAAACLWMVLMDGWRVQLASRLGNEMGRAAEKVLVADGLGAWMRDGATTLSLLVYVMTDAYELSRDNGSESELLPYEAALAMCGGLVCMGGLLWRACGVTDRRAASARLHVGRSVL